MAADGTGQSQLTNLRATTADANWSPRGDQIAFSTGSIYARDIAVVAATGGAPRRLTSGGAYQFPAWSPDGRQIAFNQAPFGTTIYVIDAPDETGAGGGGTPRRVTYPSFGSSWRFMASMPTGAICRLWSPALRLLKPSR